MAGVRVQFSIPNDMNDHPAPNSHDKDAQITEIVAALVAESPADLDSEIALRCAGDTELEEAVRSLLETRMGVEVDGLVVNTREEPSCDFGSSGTTSKLFL